jgi:hypothetical protein
VRLIADARRETPEATLTELAERLDLHRSAVQRALERIERLAEAEPTPPTGPAPAAPPAEGSGSPPPAMIRAHA